MLTHITDHRGLLTTVSYRDGASLLMPYPNAWVPSIVCWRVLGPNGVASNFRTAGFRPLEGPYSYGVLPDFPSFLDYVAATDEIVNEGTVAVTLPDPSPGYPAVRMQMQALGRAGTTPVVFWDRLFHAFTRDVFESKSPIDNRLAGAAGVRVLAKWTGSQWVPTSASAEVKTVTSYNFRGEPLEVRQEEWRGGALERTTLTQHAYWGLDRFFQRKATAVTFTGLPTRISYTNAAGFQGTGVADWRETIAPAPGAAHTAAFEYDPYGRTTKVFKLHRNGPTRRTKIVASSSAFGLVVLR